MMLVITDNSYLRTGLSILFSNHFENTEMLENYNIVLYDRGDGVISIIMASVFFKMLHSKSSFTSLLLGNFPLFNYREDGIDTLINIVKRLLRRNGQSLGSNSPYYNKRRTLTEQERRVLMLLITPSKKMNDIANELKVGAKTIFSIKYNVLTKLGVSSLSSIIKIHNQWHGNFG